MAVNGEFPGEFTREALEGILGGGMPEDSTLYALIIRTKPQSFLLYLCSPVRFACAQLCGFSPIPKSHK